ncbi:MAG: sigma-54-dependent transcriptional regulator [Terriglobia bacterium]
MIENPGSILVVDDEPSMLRYLQTLLEVDSYKVATARSGVGALRLIREGLAPDLILLDLLMPELDGLETLEQLRQIQPGVNVVMLSCVTDTRKVAQAIKLGAQDYLTKPFKKAELDAVLAHCLSDHSVPQPSGQVEELSEDQYFVAASAAMRKIRAQVAQLAQVDVPVLMLGESGTGKEVVARLIHKLSRRADRTWMKVNCAALPADLLESELFGYEPGAFTGATRSKPGKFELCDKGTFLLDEIGEMPPALQAKLLHVLQDQQFSRLGSRTMVKVDVRILAATNIDIPEAIASRKFREDLYYRLNAFTINVPPLRERKEEIPLLIRHFMGLFAARYARAPLAVSPALIDACLNYRWPGNLRELENFVKRYLILGDEALALMELEAKKEEQQPSPVEAARDLSKEPPGDLKSLVRGLKDEAECEAISRALKHTKWNRKEAARMLKISYKALLYKIRQYNLDRT